MYSLFVITLIVSTQLLFGGAIQTEYQKDGIRHSYTVELMTGPMEKDPVPVSLSLVLLKEIPNLGQSGDFAQLSSSFQFKANTKYQFDFESDMPFNQIDLFSIEWVILADAEEGNDSVVFETGKITETTPSMKPSRKLFCTNKEYESFVMGGMGSAIFWPC